MLKEAFMSVAAAGEGKVKALHKTPMSYFVASMVAGAFISFGGFFSLTVGALTSTTPFCKLLAALAFSSALSLVVAAGSELFTGNNMTVAAAAMDKRVSWAEVALLWIVCYLGNLAGSWLLVGLYQGSGVCTPAISAWIASAAQAKVSAAPFALVFRGILCNICVCLGVWCSIKMKSESGKLIMCIWTIMIFMVCGFEHSVANMSIIGTALAQGTVSFGSYLYNLFFVTIGNIIGGAGFVALPYWLMQKDDA